LFSPSWKRRWLDEPESGRLEDRPRLCGGESVMLLEGHPFREPQPLQDRDDPIHRRLRDGRDEPPPLAEQARRRGTHRRVRRGREVLDDREHRDRVEALVRRVGGEHAAHEPDALAPLRRRRVGVDADPAGHPVAQHVEQLTVGASDVEHARSGRDPRRGHRDAPSL